MEYNVPFQFHIFSTKWKGNGMEKERKKHITQLESMFDTMDRNGMELEWKIFANKNRWAMWWKWKGNGMEIFLTKQVETNFDIMEWK